MIHYTDERVTLHHGDALDVLRALPDSSVDAVVTDPPYNLSFMGKAWDNIGQAARPTSTSVQKAANPYGAARVEYGGASYGTDQRANMQAFQAWCESWATECYRVLKPGGYALCFGGTRTFHRLAAGIEDAGFEIRDSIFWVYGSGFPKSRNVTKDLESLPRCTCDVRDQPGAVDAVLPASTVGARIGAEAGSVPPAGLPTDQAVGVGPQVFPAPTGRASDVNPRDVGRIGEGPPVVLGPLPVAATTEGEQVVSAISDVEIDPEPLWDQVMGEQALSGAAVSTGAVPLNDGGGDVGPSPALVLPLPTTPRGIAGTVQPLAVVDGHACAGAVDPAVGPAPELLAADGAGMDAVPATGPHGAHSTAERMARCEVCGGLRGTVPQGLGTALKPSAEPVVVARKPLAGTVAANVTTWGTGALNVDGCRVPSSDADKAAINAKHAGMDADTYERTPGASLNLSTNPMPLKPAQAHAAGRWPTNVVLTHAYDCGTADQPGPCVEGCPVRDLDQQSGVTQSTIGRPRGAASGDGWGMTATGAEYADAGGASRFFPTFRYEAKAPTIERPRVGKGTEAGVHNNRCAKCGKTDLSGNPCVCPEKDWIPRTGGEVTAHPTVKPLDLMRWLVRLVTPPGGTVLEPFAGSGTTAEACVIEGMHCIAVEREADYLPLIVARLSKPIELDLFGGVA